MRGLVPSTGSYQPRLILFFGGVGPATLPSLLPKMDSIDEILIQPSALEKLDSQVFFSQLLQRLQDQSYESSNATPPQQFCCQFHISCGIR